MKTGDFLKDLANKIGKTNDPAFAELFTLDSELPNEQCDAIISGLMSLEHAKSKLKGSLRAETLNGVDAKLKQIISDKLGLTIEFEDGTDTFQKFDKFAETIKETLEKKPEKSSEADKSLKQAQADLIAERQGRTADNEKAANTLAQTKADYEARYMEDAKKNALRGKNWANKKVSEETWIKVANQSIAEALQKVGAQEVLIDGKLNLVLANDPTSPYFDEKGVTVSHEDFINRVIAEQNLIAVTEPPKNDFQPYITNAGSHSSAQSYGNPIDARMARQKQLMNEAANATLAAFQRNKKQE